MTPKRYHSNERLAIQPVLSRRPSDQEDWPDAIPVPPPLSKRDQFPAWFNEQVVSMYPDWFEGLTPDEYSPLNLLVEKYGLDLKECFRHWGTAVYAGEEWLILEPYPLAADQLHALMKFTEDFGLGFNIQAGSAHQPCKTLRIMIRPRGGWREDFLQEVEAYS